MEVLELLSKIKEVRLSKLFALEALKSLPLETLAILGDAQAQYHGGGLLVPRVAGYSTSIGVTRNGLSCLQWLDNSQDITEARQALSSVDASLELLILQGVLEYKSNGHWATGPHARELIDLLVKPPQSDRTPENISHSAILQAVQYSEHDIFRLSSRLYFFNRLPVPEMNSRQYTQFEELANTIEAIVHNAASGSKSWEQKTAQGYHSFFRQGFHLSDEKAVYKLYLSPALEQYAAILPDVLDACIESDCVSFKIGSEVSGLLRPDKIVAYFENKSGLLALSKRLDGTLSDTPSHDLPFTAPLNSKGTISWGLDPPKILAKALPWQERQSWRLWVTNRIASSMIFAHCFKQSAQEIVRYCLARLECEGVDTKNWEPKDHLMRSFNAHDN